MAAPDRWRPTAAHAAAVALWLVAWQLASVALAQPLILPGPVEVLSALGGLVSTPTFWSKVGFSLARIVGGCALAYAVAGLLAWASGASCLVRIALRPPLVAIKATPVACVVVLLLIWLGAANVSFAAVFLMALPGVYFALVEGLDHVDARMDELLCVSGVRGPRRWLALTWPAVLPFLEAASEVVVGMAWKAGVAAELIGTPLGSIGERIYQAKLLLDTPALFAWTVVVVCLATVCERTFLLALRGSGRLTLGLSVRLRPRVRAAAPEAAPATVAIEGEVLPHGAAAGRPLSVSVGPADRLCVTGPSGAGKTTLLRALARAAGGRVSFDFQDARLFDGASAFQNAALTAAPWRTDDDVRRMLAQALPDVDLGRPVAELSGGQRRRVELVRALAAGGGLVVLDEPFSGLDAPTHAAMCSLVLRELRGRSLVVATHDPSDARALCAETFEVPVSFSSAMEV